MNASTLILASTLLLPSVAWAGKNKVQHKNIVPAAGADVAVDLGLITGMTQHGGQLYLAGQKGVAAVDGSGAVLWKVDLDPTAFRDLAVGDQGVAWTGWSVAGVDPATGFANFAMGKIGDKLIVENARFGLVGLDGASKWTVDSPDAEPLSAPGWTGDNVMVMTGKRIIALKGADGSKAGETTELFAGQNWKAFEGFYDSATRSRPVAIGDKAYTSVFGYIFQVNHDGTFVEKALSSGLTAPYVNITCGPVALGDTVVFGSTGDTQTASMYFGLNAKLKGEFKFASPDTNSGCGSVWVDGDIAYFASNFWVNAVNAKGKIVWQSVNKKGGLYPAKNRGVRYIRWFGARKSFGDMLVAGGGKVYVATDNGGDVITVLDQATGAYVETRDLKKTIVSMAIIGDKLAVAHEGGLTFLPR